MSRRMHFDWFASHACPRRPSVIRTKSAVPHSRRLRMEPLEDRRLLAVLTVTSDADDLIAGDGLVTLREAITAANINFATDLGDIGDPAPVMDTIVFDPALNGDTILLDPFLGSLPVIIEDLAIDASALTLGLTVDGGDGFDLLPGTFDGFSVFIVGGPAFPVDLIGLSITGGDTPGAGGGILNMGDLLVNECNVFGNAAAGFGGGISSDGVLTVFESIIDDNMAGVAGGGIYAMVGDAFLRECTVSNNTSGGDGGGLGCGAFGPGMILTVTRSTFVDNTAIGDGGGIWVMSPGGLTTTITNSTISGNEANDDGGGLALFTGFGDIATVEHSTITLNSSDADADGIGAGGGIFSVGPAVLAIDHTIVAENFDEDVAGAAAATFSLIGFDPFGAVIDVVGNLIGVAADIDPMLAPLSNNGGSTLTHRPLPGSPAINTGDPFVVPPPTTDQRGIPFLREDPVTFLIDKGAYEVQDLGGPTTWIVNTLEDKNNGDDGPGDVSLREAIGLANGNLGFSDIITFAPALSGGTIVLSDLLGELTVTDGVTIDASGLPGGVSIDAGDGADGLPGTGDGLRIFNIEDLLPGPTIDIELVGLTLTGGDVSIIGGSGGAILSEETLNLVDCVVTGNATSGGGGGGIFSMGPLTVTESTISMNSTTGFAADGGGIASFGPLTITESTISMNSTSGVDAEGGGISNGGMMTVMSSAILGNSTSGDGALGGGIASFGPLTVTDSTISGNSTSGDGAYGGGLYCIGSLTVAGSTISDNSTAGIMGFGGGVASFGVATVSDSLVSGNSTAAISLGGGIFAGGSLTVARSTVSDNFVFGEGGGINIAGSGSTLTINSSTVSGNAAVGAGGGIATNGSSVVVAIESSTVSGNTAGSYGGGISMTAPAGAASTISRSTITGNSASGEGGGISVTMFGTRTLALDHTIVAGNSDETGVAPDLRQFPIPGLGILTASYSLIGNATGSAPVNVGGTSLIGTGVAPIDPMLGPLADNGGPTMTHSLLAGSPAIDAGDPAAVAGVGGVPEFDQRGATFARVVGAGIDIGAFESTVAPPALPGDYNLDGIVDTADYIAWRNTLGTVGVPIYSGADGDGDGVIDQDDYVVWRANFGNMLPPPAAGSGATALAFAYPAFEVVSERDVPVRAKTSAASVEPDSDSAQATRLAILDARATRHDAISRPREEINIFAADESGADNLLLLLAIDRLRHSWLQNGAVVGNSGRDEHRADERDNHRHNLPLALALAEWP